MTSFSKFFNVVLILLSILFTGPSLVVFYKGLNRNLEIEISPSEFSPKSGDWGESRIPILARMTRIKCY